MSTISNLTLNNGVEIPAIGFGVFQTPAGVGNSLLFAHLEHRRQGAPLGSVRARRPTPTGGVCRPRHGVERVSVSPMAVD